MKLSVLMTALMLLIIGVLSLPACEQANNHKDSMPATVLDSVSSADGLNIVYEVNGPATSDLTLVFVHCWSCDRGYWRNQVPVFSKDYKVVTIDLAGHGQSALGRAEWTMQAYGQDVVAVIEKLGLDNVVLIGHSMGGSIITTAAKQLPGKVKALVGVDTFDGFGTTIPEGSVDNYIASLRANFSETTKAFVGTLIAEKADSSLRQWITDDMSGGDPVVGAESMLGILQYAYSDDVIADLKEVNLPLYLINSPKNTKRLDKVREVVPLLDVKIQSDVVHFGHMTQAKEFNNYLRDILGDIQKNAQ